MSSSLLNTTPNILSLSLSLYILSPLNGEITSLLLVIDGHWKAMLEGFMSHVCGVQSSLFDCLIMLLIYSLPPLNHQN